MKCGISCKGIKQTVIIGQLFGNPLIRNVDYSFNFSDIKNVGLSDNDILLSRFSYRPNLCIGFREGIATQITNSTAPPPALTKRRNIIFK